MHRALCAGVFGLILLPAATGLGQGPSSPDQAPVVMQDRRAAMPVLVMLIGGGPRFREARLDVGDGAGGTDRRVLPTNAYFDFGWHLLVRPMGQRSVNPRLQAIVIQLDGGSAIGLDVQPTGVESELQTNAWRLLGQFGYLYPRHRLRFGGLVGVGADVLGIDRNSVFPSSSIVYVRLGPAVAYEIVRRYLTMRADFGLRTPFLLGELESAFGNRTRSVGVDAALSFEGRVKAGFAYALRATWEYYHYRFSGTTRTVPAQSAGGGDGNDHAATLQLLIGWSL